MGYIVSFLLGALIGALTALFVTPKSGQDLRAQLRAEADVDMQRARAEWNARMTELNSTIDKAKLELSDQVSKISKTIDQKAQELKQS